MEHFKISGYNNSKLKLYDLISRLLTIKLMKKVTYDYELSSNCVNQLFYTIKLRLNCKQLRSKL